ncbi:MAG: hypothetical protein CME47_04595 [Halieaceae bacterium]|nr:hypothetical protein [Halieaceae bacterium]
MKTGKVGLPAGLAQHRRPLGNCWALIGCVLIAAILSGCSATQVIYNRADILIRWYLDDYVTFDPEQQAQFDARLDALLDWHRQEELPEYVLLLDDALLILDNDVSLAATRSMAEGIESAAIRLQDRFLELLLSTGENLTSAQRADFIDALLEKQEAFETDRLARSDAEYRDDLGQRFDKQLGRYLGRLTDEQARRLQEGVAGMTRLDHFWLQDRRVWILALSNILLADEPDWADQVRALIAGRDEALLPDYRQGIEHNGEVILQLSRDVLLMRTEKQDKKLRARLIALRDDLAALSDA